MSNLYLDSVYYGIDDVSIGPTRPARVFFPSEEGNVFSASVRPGTYPLVVFVHGSRTAVDQLCPEDVTQDYKAWGSVLHLLARCGFVVVAPDVHDALSDPVATADVVEETVRWMHFKWPHRAVLWRPSVFVDPDRHSERAFADDRDVGDPTAIHIPALGVGIGVDLDALGMGMTTPVGVAGHSWGARGCALVAARGNITVDALASIAGSWDDNESLFALYSVSPTLMIAGTADLMNAGYLAGTWEGLRSPKHQALLWQIGHWDWFSHNSGLHPCDPDAPRPMCRVGWLTAAELLLTFMTKHLKNQWMLPSHLIGPPGDRTALRPYYDNARRCGLRVRWIDPLRSGPDVGGATFGYVPAADYPW